MKLKNILLPFAATTALVGSTVPFITSCGKGISFKIGDDEFKSTIADKDLPTTFTGEDLTKEYLKLVDDNKRVFADDWVYSQFYYEKKDEHFIHRDVKYSVNISNVEPDQHTFDIKISMKAHYDLDPAKQETPLPGKELVSDTTQEFKVEGFKILVGKLDDSPYKSKYFVATDPDWGASIKLTDTNIEYSAHNKSVLDDATIADITYKKVQGLQGMNLFMLNNFELSLAPIMFFSHYLENVQA